MKFTAAENAVITVEIFKAAEDEKEALNPEAAKKKEKTGMR